MTHELATSGWQERPGRDEGILRGLGVKVVKCLDRLVAATAENNGETQLVFVRLTLETVVNLGYLLQGPVTRFDEFVWDSMTTARIRRETIQANISARGLALPIEARQLRAIEDEAILAECDLDRPTSLRPRLPPLEQRFIGTLESGSFLYDFAYRIGSMGIHGTWKDLIAEHVTSDGRFEPICEWSEADLMPLFIVLLIANEPMVRYAEHLGEAQLAAALSELDTRVRGVIGIVFDNDGSDAVVSSAV